MLREKRVRDFFVCEGQKTWQKAKRREKKQTGRAKRREKKQLFESKKEAKNKKSKKKSEKRKERHKKNFFSKTQILFFFLHFSLEKIHHFERRLRTQRRLYEDSLRRESVEEEREMSSSDENSATADRVEKKSIDEAIASFAMLVRIECVFILYVFVCFYVRVRGEED